MACKHSQFKQTTWLVRRKQFSLRVFANWSGNSSSSHWSFDQRNRCRGFREGSLGGTIHDSIQHTRRSLDWSKGGRRRQGEVFKAIIQIWFVFRMYFFQKFRCKRYGIQQHMKSRSDHSRWYLWIKTMERWTLYHLASVCIFSILFSMHFLRCWQGEFIIDPELLQGVIISFIFVILMFNLGGYYKDKSDRSNS